MEMIGRPYKWHCEICGKDEYKAPKMGPVEEFADGYFHPSCEAKRHQECPCGFMVLDRGARYFHKPGCPQYKARR